MELLSNPGLAPAHGCVSHIFSSAISNRLLSSLPHYLLLSSVLLNKDNVGTQPALAHRPPGRGSRKGAVTLPGPSGYDTTKT